MSEQAISQAEIDAVFPKVAQIVSDALGCELEDVKPKASLIQDLDAESIDFLDLVFRLEKGFGVKIPRGKIVEDARGPLPEAEFETKGIVTEAGLARLREFLERSAGRSHQDAAEGRRRAAPVHHRDLLQGRDPRAARRRGLSPALPRCRP